MEMATIRPPSRPTPWDITAARLSPLTTGYEIELDNTISVGNRWALSICFNPRRPTAGDSSNKELHALVH